MRYIRLGDSDLKVSRICMGCMGFGDGGKGQHSWTLDEAHSREIIKRGLELGVNFFDTAAAYQGGPRDQETTPAGRMWQWLPSLCQGLPGRQKLGLRDSSILKIW